MQNLDLKTVRGFGDEWERFDQAALAEAERVNIFNDYFGIFPWDRLPPDPVGFDLGCGSGRWAQLVAPRVGKLHCIDPSSAIDVARRNLGQFGNVEFHANGVDDMPVANGSMDFGYSLGVLHHIPDTAAAMRNCVAKLKPSAPFLVYLYYAFDNRPPWYRMLWKASELIRCVVSGLPHGLRFAVSQLLAGSIYWPLARLARLGEQIGINTESWPLTFYRHLSFYTMRTDALDRFGTGLEQRFSKADITAMMLSAGLSEIEFSPSMPYWCAVGIKA